MSMWGKILQWIIPVLFHVPQVIADIEKNHSDKSGTDKRGLAVDMLTDAAVMAQIVDPKDADKIAASKAAVGTLVDGTVALANATGIFQH